MDLTEDTRDFLITELLDILSNPDRDEEEKRYAGKILSELNDDGDNPSIQEDEKLSSGDIFTVTIDRRSKGGNLISRQSNRIQIQDKRVDGNKPSPAERWIVQVPSDGSLMDLEPVFRVEEINDYTSKAPLNPSNGLDDSDNLNELLNGHL